MYSPRRVCTIENYHEREGIEGLARKENPSLGEILMRKLPYNSKPAPFYNVSTFRHGTSSKSTSQPSPPNASTTSRIVIVRRQEHRPRVRIPWVKIPHLHRPLHRTRTPRPEIHKQHPKHLGRAARGLRHDVPGLHPVHADRGWKCALPDQDGDDVFGDGRRWGGGEVARYVVYGYRDGDVGQAEEAFLDEGFQEGGGVREVGCDEEVVGWDGHGGGLVWRICGSLLRSLS